MKPSVLVTRRLPSTVIARLEDVFDVDLHTDPSAISRDDLHRRVAGRDALVCLLTDTIDAAVLDAAGPSLKVVANVAVGYNNIDVAACRDRRTQDATTLAASTRLFKKARTPAAMARLTVKQIERLIYPVSFYRNKAEFVKQTCAALVRRFDGRVPSTLDELVTLPGVGRKTATLVLILAFQSQRHICVDTHVHRISNRLGWVRTRQPDETEQALYAATDAKWWPYLNLYLVTWGQNVCRPVYPRCGGCAIRSDCPRIGVTRVGKGRPEEE